MSGSSRKFRRAQWRNQQPGEALPPEWSHVEERERAAYAEVLEVVKAKMPGRAFVLLTCPPGATDVPVEAIGYGSNLDDRSMAVQIFHALEDHWQQHGIVGALARARHVTPPGAARSGGFHRRVRDLWADFEASILPEDASDVQRQEMRRSYYAGAFALLDAVSAATSPGDEMTADDERLMIDLVVEREEYIVALKAGRA